MLRDLHWIKIYKIDEHMKGKPGSASQLHNPDYVEISWRRMCADVAQKPE